MPSLGSNSTRIVLLRTGHWLMAEIVDAGLVELRRSAEPFATNLDALVECDGLRAQIGARHATFGVFVDLREACLDDEVGFDLVLAEFVRFVIERFERAAILVATLSDMRRMRTIAGPPSARLLIGLNEDEAATFATRAQQGSPRPRATRGSREQGHAAISGAVSPGAVSSGSAALRPQVSEYWRHLTEEAAGPSAAAAAIRSAHDIAADLADWVVLRARGGAERDLEAAEAGRKLAANLVRTAAKLEAVVERAGEASTSAGALGAQLARLENEAFVLMFAIGTAKHSARPTRPAPSDSKRPTVRPRPSRKPR
jgi:hypothetical protein